jgi:hypothetical protein
MKNMLVHEHDLNYFCCGLKEYQQELNYASYFISDPYVRVAFANSSQSTEMLVQTLCPTWDQTLIFENIPMYGSVEEVQDNPPIVVLEFFDRDAVVSFV